jgi:hypothetical protein
MFRRLLFVAVLLALTLSLPACPPESIVGTWLYYDCEGGAPLATVVFRADGTMSYQAPGGGGEGTWTEVDGDVDFTATVQFAAQGILIFSGTVLATDRIEGEGTSDQAPGGPCIVMLR